MKMKTYNITLVNGGTFYCNYYYVLTESNEISMVFNYDESSEMDIFFMLLVAAKNEVITTFEKNETEFIATLNVLQIKKVEFK